MTEAGDVAKSLKAIVEKRDIGTQITEPRKKLNFKRDVNSTVFFIQEQRQSLFQR